MIRHFILDRLEPKEVSLLRWGRWYEKPERIICQETHGDFWVSTIFIGIWVPIPGCDHREFFETCVFDNGKPIRYKLGTTWVESTDSDVRSRGDTLVQAYMQHDLAVAECLRITAERKAARKRTKPIHP